MSTHQLNFGNLTPRVLILLTQLLKRHPPNRLGNTAEDALPIKNHSFFRQIDWENLLARRIEPPYKITVVSLGSLMWVALLR